MESLHSKRGKFSPSCLGGFGMGLAHAKVQTMKLTPKQKLHLEAIDKTMALGNLLAAQGLAAQYAKAYKLTQGLSKWFSAINVAVDAWRVARRLAV